jgi:hemolysin III
MAEMSQAREEFVNTLTHGMGLTLSLAAAPVLIIMAALRGTAWHIISVSVYSACLLILYACSTIYHSLQVPRWKDLFRVADHSAIHLLIAGTYTPFALVNLHGPWGWFLLTAVWSLSVMGIVGKLLLAHRMQVFSIILYIVTGWLVIVAAKPMLHFVPAGGLLWLLAGGLLYTGGLVFFAWQRCPYNHAVWHVFVLGGSACHYIAVMLYVVPARIAA